MGCWRDALSPTGAGEGRLMEPLSLGLPAPAPVGEGSEEGARASLEAVMLIGLQGAGKSTFYRNRFFDTHIRLNLDMVRTRHRLRLLLQGCLDAKQPFVLDNTHPTAADRAPYIALVKAAGFRLAGYYFEPDVLGSVRRNAQRPQGKRVPPVAIYATAKKLQPPTHAEGFDQLYTVRLSDAGGYCIQDRLDEH